MALADTARLVASLELQDKFSKNAAAAERALGGLERKSSTLGRIGSEASRGTQAAVTNIAKIGLVAGGVIAASVVQGVQSLQRLEEVTVATNTVLESTKGISGQTADGIRNLAEKYEALNATMDDKVIQSGENLLLTFTNIRKKAFEPALEAALNMNQAMGGGEEGLQSTIIQVGKALNDPIKGVTALRRVGVQLSKQQEDQIKTLIEQNDLYGAQRIILDELTTQFGGQFAAAGDTAAGKMAKFRDAVEDTQMSLATAFLPVMERVAERASEFLADPKVQAQIKEFGEGLASGLEQVIGFAERLPWGAIGDTFKLIGQGAKAALDLFTGLPSWVQTAVLTGWGLNKLTGGALGNIAGTLAKGAFGSLRGTTPANPVFTKEVGLPGTGGGAPLGGVPAAAAAGGGLAGALALGGGILLPFAMFNLIPELFRGPEGAGRQTVERRNEQGETIVKLDAQTTAMFQGLMPSFISTVERNGGVVTAAINESSSLNDQSLSDLREETRSLHDPLGAISDINKRSALGIEETRDEVRDLQVQNKASIVASDAKRAAQHSQAIERQNTAIARIDAMKMATDGVSSAVRTTASTTAARLSAIEGLERGSASALARTAAASEITSRKNFNPTLNASINVNTTVSVDNVIRRVESHSVATDFRGGWSEL